MFNPTNLKNFIGGNTSNEVIEKSKPDDKISKSIDKIIELNQKGFQEDFKIKDKKVESKTDDTVEIKPISENSSKPDEDKKTEKCEPIKTHGFENLIQLVMPNVVNAAFDRSTMHKIINGERYKNYDEFREKAFLNCFIETCQLTWENTPWQNR